MEDQEYPDQAPVDIQSSVARFEEMVHNKTSQFFDSATFENIVFYYEQKELWRKALQVLDFALEQHPYSSWFMLKKASLLIYFRKFRQAEELLQRAEVLDPSDLSIPVLRSDIFLEKNQHQQAIAILEESLLKAKDGEEHEELYLEMADVFEDWGRYEQVFDSLKKVLEINHENEEALNRIWYCVELTGMEEESIELHKKIIDANPYSYIAWHNLGHAYYDLGNYESAAEAYEFVTAINESNEVAYRDCANAYFQLRQYRKSIEQYQKAVEYSNPNADLYFSLGLCYEKLKDLTKARSFYRKATSVNVRYSQAFYRIAETYSREKIWENALSFYKKALYLFPDSVDYLLGLAKVFYNQAELELLIFAIQSVMAVDAQFKNKRDYEKLVEYLVDLECYEEALQLMDFASIEIGPLASYAFLRTVCFLRTGRKKEGFTWLEEGLSTHPSRLDLIFKFVPDLRNDKQLIKFLNQFH